MMRLFHISEDDTIDLFEPRPSPSSGNGVTEPSVWAIDQHHLRNYLLPRDCPRVTYYPVPTSTPEDIARLIGPSGAPHVVAIEAAWFERAYKGRLCIYEFRADTFLALDLGAGYHVSTVPVTPIGKRIVERPLEELVSMGSELRVISSLWPLCDAVIASSLQFSCIRMRNAQPRAAAPSAVPEKGSP